MKHPRSNGLVEKANRSFGEGIKARLGEGNKNWIEELPHVMWAHRTMIKSSHGDTPFFLTYGTEAVIPAKIGMPTYRTAAVDTVHNDEELRLNLDLLEEKRERAAICEAKAKMKMTKYYNLLLDLETLFIVAMTQVMLQPVENLDQSGKDLKTLRNNGGCGYRNSVRPGMMGGTNSPTDTWGHVPQDTQGSSIERSEAKAKMKITKYYNARVRGVAFRPGDFVYRNNDASHAAAGGKLGPKWEGPYEVTETLGDGTYKLRTMAGADLPQT
ncbi:reverse transcriptase domain-containing protein [Tanacetum coccineum]|uniref:Reverse transcriptase domain-containing protein n=1 Tax=Tanacetum coccineum TaxID=301880 RepID=A0ABQ5JCS3_9ASTR